MEKILFVIGASSDMGCALIKDCHKEYSLIIAHYRTMNENLSSLREELKDRLFCVQADLSKEEDVIALINKINDKEIIPTHIVHFPAPLCNNQKFHKISWDVYQNEIDISVKSLVLILKELMPKMAKQKFGRVVIMLSFVVNNIAPAYCTNYVMVKYALLGLMKSLATEYASKGITVNGISPSWVNTHYIDNQPDILKEKNASESPLGRNLEVMDVIPGIEYLLADSSSCVNGQNLIISCGK